MDSEEFRKRGREMVDYMANYMETISERRVMPSIEPGYLKKHLPHGPPMKGEAWDSIMEDVDRFIMPGVTHWEHPRFHAFFPSGNSYPSILGDMLSGIIGSVGFSWASSPAHTELEALVLDWLAQMIGLPKEFTFQSDNSKGGGVIQGSASECVLVSLLAAREAKIKELKKQNPLVGEDVLLSKLMVYCSKEAHTCVEKAAKIAFVKIHKLDTDENFSLRASALVKAIEEDKNKGLIPFVVMASWGTTSCCSFDNLEEIGPVCKAEDLWLHIDAAYAGTALICPEVRHLMKGVEYADSFNMNPQKLMLTNLDLAAMWVKDKCKLIEALSVDAAFLDHRFSGKTIDYRNWSIPLGRRFRSLKLWFVIRKYGVEGIQKHVRQHMRLAKKFENLVRLDDRFEVPAKVHLGLVCFRLKSTLSISKRVDMDSSAHILECIRNNNGTGRNLSDVSEKENKGEILDFQGEFSRCLRRLH